MVEYKKFKVGELFDIHPTKSYKMTNRKLMYNDGKVAVLTNTSTNNGVGGWSDLDPTETNSLPMITFSDTTTGPDTLFVQTKPYIGYSHVQGMYSKIDHHWTDLELLYVVVAIKAGAGTGWSYATKFNRKRVSNLDILLPVTSSGQPDFKYMTQYIKDMECQCVDDLKAKQKEELQAYLQVTGFTDTTLSVSEASALTKKVVWKKFRIGDVFDIHPSVRKINANAVKFNGHYPYVARGISTNGIRGYIDWDTTDLNPANTISFGQDTATIYYQDKPYFTGDKIQIFELKDNFPELNPAIAQFFITCLNAVFGSYSWGQQSFAVKKLRNADFMLPINANNQIDFIYMQNYIRAIEKQTIKNVVKYRNDVIKTTQQVVDPTV